jgi:hypothetical protein
VEKNRHQKCGDDGLSRAVTDAQRAIERLAIVGRKSHWSNDRHPIFVL